MQGIRIGRISGFDVRVHWSTLVIFTILVISLSTVQFPDEAPGYRDAAYWAAAVLTGLVFYASLLAHEVSHAVLARRDGIAVESLTLWMLGGVASLEGEPKTPRGDFQIAAIGPAVSLVLAGLFGAAGAVAAAADGSPLVQATLAWLAGINGVLAVFNLIPAAPLDGGRILRAAVWHFRGDRSVAAVTAARAGEVFGYVLVGLGLLRLFSGAGGGGIWLMLVGWFVLNAARSERAQVHVRDALAGLTVRDVMTPAPVTAPDDITVASLLDDYLMRTRHSAFPLVDVAGRPTGLVTLPRIKAVPSADRDIVFVRDVACSREEMVTARPDDPVLDVVASLNRCSEGRVMVLSGDRLVGIVTPTDVTRVLELASAAPRVVDVRDRTPGPSVRSNS